jgi:ornithine carbamoyltransferase
MPINLKGRSFLTLLDYSSHEIQFLLDSARAFKRLKLQGSYPKNLTNKNIALIFLKPSCRTRTSFLVAAIDEGAHLEIFPKEDIRFGIKESVKDIARVLGRMFDGIAFRGFDHELVKLLAEYSGVPVWNGLCDMYHPTQVLADFMTVLEEFEKLEGIKLTYIGDGRNNMARSLMIGSVKMGVDVRIVSPASLHPTQDSVSEILDHCMSTEGECRGKITLTENIEEGVADCDVIYSDVWVSMGEEALIKERIALLKDYRITKEMMDLTGKPSTIFLHCLPALHDMNTEMAREYPDILEVTDEVFESSKSRVFDQAENRMHTIKALMVASI